MSILVSSVPDKEYHPSLSSPLLRIDNLKFCNYNFLSLSMFRLHKHS